MADKNSSPVEEPSKKRIGLWIAIWVLGLLLIAFIAMVYIYQPNDWTTPSQAQFEDLATDPQGRIWGISFREGLVSFDAPGQIELIALDTKLMDSNPHSLALDSKGRIWVGTDDSLGMRDINGEWKIFTPDNRMDDARIHDIVVDGQDRAWISIGSYGSSGLGVIDPASDPGATYTFLSSGIHGRVISIAVDQQGSVWCINEDNQLMVLGADENWEQRATLPEDSEGALSLAIDQQGLAWVGTNGTVYHLGHDNQWTTYTIGDPAVMNTIQVILIDHQGRVWAGSYYQGAFMWDASAGWTSYNPENSGLKGDSVYAMAVDGENRVWIATSAALSQFDGIALSLANVSANREKGQIITTIKNISPIIAYGAVLIVILAIAFSGLKVNRLTILRNIIIGFLGWYLLFSIYWGFAAYLANFFPGPSAMALLPLFCFPLPANIITLIFMMIQPRRHWIGVGAISALVVNSIGIILYQEIDESTIWTLLMGVPFFIQGI